MIEQIISEVILREGAVFTNDPADAGGPTKYGITQTTLSRWLGHEATIDEVKGLTSEDARRVYRFLYVEEPRFDDIADAALQALVVDCAVLHGQTLAAGWLQAAAGVKQDGKIGPVSIAAVNASRPLQLFLRICAKRWRYMGMITQERPTNLKWLEGWCNRGSSFLDQVATLTAGAAAQR